MGLFPGITRLFVRLNARFWMLLLAGSFLGFSDRTTKAIEVAQVFLWHGVESVDVGLVSLGLLPSIL